MTIPRPRKLAATAVLFVLGFALVLVASVAREAWPLFLAWVPLLTVPWVLTRPESDDEPAATDGEDEPAPTDEDAPSPAGS